MEMQAMEMHLQSCHPRSGSGALPPRVADRSALHPSGRGRAFAEGTSRQAGSHPARETGWIPPLIRRSKECRGNLSGKNVGGRQLQAAHGSRAGCSDPWLLLRMRGLPAPHLPTPCPLLPSRRIGQVSFASFGEGKARDQVLISWCLPVSGAVAPWVRVWGCRFSVPWGGSCWHWASCSEGTTQHPAWFSLGVQLGTAPLLLQMREFVPSRSGTLGRELGAFSGKGLVLCTRRKRLWKQILQNPLMPRESPQRALAVRGEPVRIKMEFVFPLCWLVAAPTTTFSCRFGEPHH